MDWSSSVYGWACLWAVKSHQIAEASLAAPFQLHCEGRDGVLWTFASDEMTALWKSVSAHRAVLGKGGDVKHV